MLSDGNPHLLCKVCYAKFAAKACNKKFVAKYCGKNFAAPRSKINLKRKP